MPHINHHRGETRKSINRSAGHSRGPLLATAEGEMVWQNGHRRWQVSESETGAVVVHP